MHKLLWQPHLLMRVPALNTLRWTEKSMFLVRICHVNCSTATPALDYRKYKSRSAVYGLRTPFQKIYNVDHSELAALLSNHLPNLRFINKAQINELLLLLKENEYKWPDIRRDKEILLLHPSVIRLRLQLLKEFSIFHPRLHDVTHIRILLQTKIPMLRQYNIYSKDFGNIDHLLHKTEKLEFSIETQAKIIRHFKNIDEFSLADIHIYMLVHYISKRFNVDLCDARLILEGHRLPLWKPLTAYVSIFDVITDVLEMGVPDILHFPKLLNIDPNNVLRIIAKHQDIGGIATIERLKFYPQLLLLEQNQLSKWILLLENYNVKNFTLTSHAIKLFQSDDFKVVEERLQVLKNIPEYELLQISRKFFEMLRDPQALKTLMELVHAGNVHHALGPVLLSQNQNPRIMSQEMKMYAARKLGLDENKGEDLLLLNEVKTNLGLANLHLVLNLLLDFGFSKEQIINCLQILSIDHSALKAMLEEFPSMPEAQPFEEWMTNPQVLHLLAYFVKRNTSHHW